jgi:hypothetical protein
MRVNFIQLDFTEEDLYYRYKDILEQGASSIRGPEALEEDYYGWIKGKDFAWFANYDGGYVIAFYENHPFFNCLRLRYGNTLLDDVGWDMACSPVSDVVEPWFRKVYKNYKRRQNRKLKA